MRKTIMILAVVLASVSMYGQNISGKWYGKFDLQGQQQNVVFNIYSTRYGFKATMDSPDKKTFGIPVKHITFNDSIIKLEIPKAGIEYLGTLNDKFSIVGVIKQSGQIFPLELIIDKTDKM